MTGVPHCLISFRQVPAPLEHDQDSASLQCMQHEDFIEVLHALE